MDYPNIWPYLRDLFQTGNIASTVDFEHIKAIYYVSSLLNVDTLSQCCAI